MHARNTDLTLFLPFVLAFVSVSCCIPAGYRRYPSLQSPRARRIRSWSTWQAWL